MLRWLLSLPSYFLPRVIGFSETPPFHPFEGLMRLVRKVRGSFPLLTQPFLPPLSCSFTLSFLYRLLLTPFASSPYLTESFSFSLRSCSLCFGTSIKDEQFYVRCYGWIISPNEEYYYFSSFFLFCLDYSCVLFFGFCFVAPAIEWEKWTRNGFIDLRAAFPRSR